ncbi:uncharacterized protein STEHIDRAFT_142610 [Stereum hirsutum FP-91666 SS1]|uniref:uncharacterized protein n=1 Tax=Stereum hirsutum (strain FP-91666) TaxID=721885 RepID=UPI000444933E|nr:uncharacterized protein STEHIDRAFT_142610 [Stereum hirsutum FP-91666 SS1]EIM80684.1 hypothetical protein STEHIDRAFT_142610 [Stereum hirsutum FP-91666 SS1]
MVLNLNLKTSPYFPTFSSLPGEPESGEVSLEYYASAGSGYLQPSKHWVFIGEIVQNISLIRPGFLVKDKRGVQVGVHFYLDNDVARTADYKKFKVGSTMCVYYAHMRYFMDGGVGIRVEDMSNVKIIPCSMKILLETNIAKVKSSLVCSTCAKKGEDVTLQQCKRCGTRYCSRECQQQDWQTGHKAKCAAISQVREWRAKDWGNFSDYWSV